MTEQPKWRLVQNLGDVNPLDFGGLFVYRDTTKKYTEEMERLESPYPGENNEPYIVHRTCLDRCKVVKDDDGKEYLVSERYEPSWPHPVSGYDKWFNRDLVHSASCNGTDVDTLRGWFCSEDPLERAEAYRAIGDYHGWDNLDSYPLTLTRAEARKRYRSYIYRPASKR